MSIYGHIKDSFSVVIKHYTLNLWVNIIDFSCTGKWYELKSTHFLLLQASLQHCLSNQIYFYEPRRTVFSLLPHFLSTLPPHNLCIFVTFLFCQSLHLSGLIFASLEFVDSMFSGILVTVNSVTHTVVKMLHPNCIWTAHIVLKYCTYCVFFYLLFYIWCTWSLYIFLVVFKK